MSVEHYVHPQVAAGTTEIALRPASEIALAQRPIDIASEAGRAYLMSTVGPTSGDVHEAWLNFRRTGEVRFAVTRSAHIAGYARLKAVKVDKAGRIIKDDTTGVEAEIVSQITSRYGGTRGLIEKFYTLMKVPGQAFPIRVRDEPNGPADGYWFLSSDEIKPDGDTPARGSAFGKPVTWRMSRRGAVNGADAYNERAVLGKDFFGRVWVPDPQFTDDASSPMSSINDMCADLWRLTRNIRSRLESRFAYAGILLIPNEISDAAISGVAPRDGLYSNDRVMNYLIHIMTANMLQIAQGGLPTVPIVLKGPAAVIDKVTHLLMESTVADTDLKLRAELIDRIFMALDQNSQATQGGKDVSHWGMWAASDEERRTAVQPDLEMFCAMWDRFVLWPELQERNRKPGDLLSWHVWFDLSAASIRSNMQEDVRQARDRGAIGLDYYRQNSGIPNTAAMTPDEEIRWIGLQTKNPVLMAHGLDAVEVDWDRAKEWGQKPGPGADSPADESEAGPGKGDPGSPDSRDSDTPKTKEPG